MGIVRYDLSGRFLSANPAACAVTGYNEAELLRMTLKDITHPDDWEESADCLQRAAQGLINSYTIRKCYIRKDGTIVHIIGYNAVAHDQVGRPAMIIGQIEDLSERLKAEEEARLHRERLAHVTRLHTLGEMAAGIAHEINQPLTAIANYTQAWAKIVPAYKVPRDVVTLNSRVTVEYKSIGERSTVTVGYPLDWDPATAIVSVLDSLGSALMGLSVGQSISWLFPDGSGRRLRVLDVADQPETVSQLWR